MDSVSDIEAGVKTLTVTDNESKAKQNSEASKTDSETDDHQTHRDYDKIVKEDVELPEEFGGKLAFVLHNVLTSQECREYIEKTEAMGYEEALLNVGNGRQIFRPDVRKGFRCIWDTHEEAQRIWGRVQAHVPTVWLGRKVMGLNERLRFLRYDPGDYFRSHMDGSYCRDNGERSYITLQLYLNQGFKGGSTTFMNYDETGRREVVPKTGSVLIFQHDIMHEGSKLKRGRKYAMRTDVMYSADVTDDH